MRYPLRHGSHQHWQTSWRNWIARPTSNLTVAGSNSVEVESKRFGQNAFAAPIVQWLEFALPKREVRVRFPVGAVEGVETSFLRYLTTLLRSL